MKTEINGDFKGYLKRFKLATKKSFLLPVKSALIIFVVQLVVACLLSIFEVSFISLLVLFVSMAVALVYYIKVLYKDFWNLVLEESKGFFADLIMWLYYFAICAISLSPTIIYCVLNEL